MHKTPLLAETNFFFFFFADITLPAQLSQIFHVSNPMAVAKSMRASPLQTKQSLCNDGRFTYATCQRVRRPGTSVTKRHYNNIKAAVHCREAPIGQHPINTEYNIVVTAKAVPAQSAISGVKSCSLSLLALVHVLHNGTLAKRTRHKFLYPEVIPVPTPPKNMFLPRKSLLTVSFTPGF